MNEDIKQAVKVLREGGLILYPTDTIWGIGCDASNEKAVERIYKLKQRADNKSMLVLVSRPEMIQFYVDEFSDTAYDLFDLTSEPLTIILDKAKNLAKNLIAEDGSIGFRVTNEEFSNKLIQQFKMPIVSTSANISSNSSPAIFDEISEEIASAVDYVIKFRQDDLSKSKPSKIIKLSNSGEIKIIR
jgi:L-threonylcarbamoyladenylate synthase